jgi:hypothetical protein
MTSVALELMLAQCHGAPIDEKKQSMSIVPSEELVPSGRHWLRQIYHPFPEGHCGRSSLSYLPCSSIRGVPSLKSRRLDKTAIYLWTGVLRVSICELLASNNIVRNVVVYPNRAEHA